MGERKTMYACYAQIVISWPAETAALFDRRSKFIGNIPYTSPFTGDSICETISAITALPFTTLTFTRGGIGLGIWTVN